MNTPSTQTQKIKTLQKAIDELQADIHSLKSIMVKIGSAKSDFQDQKSLQQMDILLQ